MGKRRVPRPDRRADDPFQFSVGVPVDLGDGGAGKDVVELVEQERFPGGLQRLLGIGEAVEVR